MLRGLVGEIQLRRKQGAARGGPVQDVCRDGCEGLCMSVVSVGVQLGHRNYIDSNSNREGRL